MGDQRIKKEITRLNKIYSDIPSKSKDMIDGLIKRAAFMRIQLEDWEDDMAENGIIEMFSQSPNTEPYERERPVCRLYNTMNKNYQTIMKQLAEYMPKQEQVEKDDGFDGFINSR